jgi:hypothetical protein
MVRHPVEEKLRLQFDRARGKIFPLSVRHAFAVNPGLADAAATWETNFSFKPASQGQTKDGVA